MADRLLRLKSEPPMTTPVMILPEQKDAVANALGHALAVYELAPGNWIRIGETAIVQEILERLAPPSRRDAGAAQPIALLMGRKHVKELQKMKPATSKGEDR
jgi:hypothetical protein